MVCVLISLPSSFIEETDLGMTREEEAGNSFINDKAGLYTELSQCLPRAMKWSLMSPGMPDSPSWKLGKTQVHHVIHTRVFNEMTGHTNCTLHSIFS